MFKFVCLTQNGYCINVFISRKDRDSRSLSTVCIDCFINYLQHTVMRDILYGFCNITTAFVDSRHLNTYENN